MRWRFVLASVLLAVSTVAAENHTNDTAEPFTVPMEGIVLSIAAVIALVVAFVYVARRP